MGVFTLSDEFAQLTNEPNFSPTTSNGSSELNELGKVIHIFQCYREHDPDIQEKIWSTLSYTFQHCILLSHLGAWGLSVFWFIITKQNAKQSNETRYKGHAMKFLTNLSINLFRSSG